MLKDKSKSAVPIVWKIHKYFPFFLLTGTVGLIAVVATILVAVGWIFRSNLAAILQTVLKTISRGGP